jgi:hypothetical protein
MFRPVAGRAAGARRIAALGAGSRRACRSHTTTTTTTTPLPPHISPTMASKVRQTFRQTFMKNWCVAQRDAAGVLKGRTRTA